MVGQRSLQRYEMPKIDATSNLPISSPGDRLACPPTQSYFTGMLITSTELRVDEWNPKEAERRTADDPVIFAGD